MSSILNSADVVMPACATFGVLFLVLEGKSARYTRVLRYAGVAMVSLALVVLWLRLSYQAGRVSTLEQRLERLEAQAR